MGEEDSEAVKKFLGKVHEGQLGKQQFSKEHFETDIDALNVAFGRFLNAQWLGGMYDSTNHRVDMEAVGVIQKMLVNLTGINYAAGTWAQAITNLIDLYDDTGKAYLFYHKRNSTDAGTIVTDSQVAVASAASSTLTCAAGHAYKVIMVGMENGSRNWTYELTYTPSGGTASLLVQNVTTQALGMHANVMGGGGTTQANSTMGPNGPIWLQAGDTLILNCTNFVAADLMRHIFIYEDYTL